MKRSLHLFTLVLFAACSSNPMGTADLTTGPQPDLHEIITPPDLTALPDLTPATCTDGARNGTETDVDCGGGACSRCGDGLHCAMPTDCAAGVCAQGVCAAATCSDGVKNGNESDVDCGGTCSPCPSNHACASAMDCGSGVCKASLCVDASCTDGVKNGNESDVDCGGSCTTHCSSGAACGAGPDCTSGVCANKLCAAAACSDKIKNGDETDIDCGGSCPPCGDNKSCSTATDCTAKVCTGGKCVTASCTDSVQNGTETDVDCGGTCPACGTGKSCGVAMDCTTGVCTSGKCATASCTDMVKNGSETDIDCGGSACLACGTGSACGSAMDCASLVCTTSKCVAASCSDSVKNGSESDVDCGGTCTTRCAAGKKCGASTDCATGLVCQSNVCATAVVSSGLVLSLDAGNPSSYPGSGTTWKDLSGNHYDATLLNTTVASDNGGGITTPAILNQVAVTIPQAPYWSFDPASQGNTLEFWWKKGSVSGHGGSIIATYPNNGGTWQIFQNASGYSSGEPTALMLYASGSSPQYWWTGSGHMLNEVSLATIVQHGTSFDYYNNGVFVSTQVRASFAETGSRPLVLGSNSAGTEVATATFYTVRWYNRQLTANEIAQNFAATRARFGK